MLEILCSFCLIYFLTDFQPCIRNSTFGYFLEIADCSFLKKNIFKIILYLFIFIQKQVTSITIVRRRKLPDLSLNNICSVLSIGLQYTLSFKWPDFGLKFRVTIMPKGQSLKFKVRALHEIPPFLNFQLQLLW